MLLNTQRRSGQKGVAGGGRKLTGGGGETFPNLTLLLLLLLMSLPLFLSLSSVNKRSPPQEETLCQKSAGELANVSPKGKHLLKGTTLIFKSVSSWYSSYGRQLAVCFSSLHFLVLLEFVIFFCTRYKKNTLNFKKYKKKKMKQNAPPSVCCLPIHGATHRRRRERELGGGGTKRRKRCANSVFVSKDRYQ